MFNRILIAYPTGVEHVTETRHEHRAPTDDSARLLSEFEAAARARIIAAANVGDAHFECIVHVEREPMHDTITARAIFSTNGKKMTAEVSQPMRKLDRMAFIESLRNAIASKIATEILIPALRDLDLKGSF